MRQGHFSSTHHKRSICFRLLLLPKLVVSLTLILRAVNKKVLLPFLFPCLCALPNIFFLVCLVCARMLFTSFILFSDSPPEKKRRSYKLLWHCLHCLVCMCVVDVCAYVYVRVLFFNTSHLSQSFPRSDCRAISSFFPLLLLFGAADALLSSIRWKNNTAEKVNLEGCGAVFQFFFSREVFFSFLPFHCPCVFCVCTRNTQTNPHKTGTSQRRKKTILELFFAVLVMRAWIGHYVRSKLL